MRTRSFVIKVLLRYFLVVAIFLVLLFVFFFRKVSEDAVADQVRHLSDIALLMGERLPDLLDPARRDDLRAYAAAKAAAMSARVTVIDRNGTVLADTGENPAYLDNHAGRPEVKRALAGEGNSVTRFSATLKKDMLYYAAPVFVNGRAAAVLRVSLFGEAVENLILGLKLTYLLIIAFLVAASTAAILVIYANFKRAIGRFSAISRQVSAGDFNVRFLNDESFEIRELSRSFENMIRRITSLIAELTSEKEEIESILSAIEEGVAVIDAEGRIVRANSAFGRMFGAETAAGRYYWEVIRVIDIVELCRSRAGDSRRFTEADADGRRLLCHVNRLPGRGETVLVCFDVTEVKNWETMKKDLVTNVSHELGTPLTAIKGYVETLLDEEADEVKRKYLGIIERHTARLAHIVRDLLLLSRLEAGRESEPEEPVDLAAVLATVRPLFEDKAAAKGLRFDCRIAAGLGKIRGDAFRLEQALINLLDNALKYTEQGGITVSLENAGTGVSLSVSDTGSGVSEADRERIFERFYVADKSRSRLQGGTGLGLAIVKHIVLAHGGDIAVNGVPGGGTEFRVTFPAIGT